MSNFCVSLCTEYMTCDVRNVIYVMKCRCCGKEYIGETGNFLRKRVTVHNQQIRDPRTRMLKVGEYIDIYANTLNLKYEPAHHIMVLIA